MQLGLLSLQNFVAENQIRYNYGLLEKSIRNFRANKGRKKQIERSHSIDLLNEIINCKEILGVDMSADFKLLNELANDCEVVT